MIGFSLVRAIAIFCNNCYKAVQLKYKNRLFIAEQPAVVIITIACLLSFATK